uniref:Uncharacterized protein n=1 Tax=Chelonoidis abingdonii TaxID=106734 RepID=A0A8C0GFW2_CHEAB
VLRWLVRVWDNAGQTVLLLRYELQQLGVMAQDAQVRAEMANPPNPKDVNGQEEESPSLYRWLTGAVSKAYPSAGELEAQVGPWKTIAEGVQALRQLGMAWAVATGGMDGPDDMPVTKSTKAAFLRTAPDELKPFLLAVVMAAGQGVERGELRVPRRVLWFDLLQAGVPPEEIDRKPTRSTGPGRERTVEPNKPAEPPAPPAEWQLPRPY